MDVRRLGGALMLLASLSGCSWTRIQREPLPKWPWLDSQNVAKSPCGGDKCRPKEALEAWGQATAYCFAYHEDLGKAALHGKSAKLGIRALGTLAGTVLQNVTTGSVSSAWGSVAGATNTIGDQLDGVLVGAVSLNQRAAVELAVDGWGREYHREQNSQKRVEIALAMARECAMSAARAEQQVLNAISQVKAADLERAKRELGK
ncbi:hypothetical protein [Lysobacter antibioticus]|uniref:hypothetical protein n=1 Tax=Lysobacter antibioticus TaxID=84531 RepID=UPI0011DF5EC1|nr:hypothetical protein [Lysobacter antibioticus]